MTISLNLKKPRIEIIELTTAGEYCQKLMNVAQKVQNSIIMESKKCRR